jgi:nitrile hydratase
VRLENLLLERGLVTAAEITAGRAAEPGKIPPLRPLGIADVERVIHRGAFARPASAAARFAPGHRVRARIMHPRTHTRLPRYVRGRTGVVERVHGCHVFPDSAAEGRGDDPQWLYAVGFEGRDLWGEDAEPGLTVVIDAFEPYLEPA